MLHDIFAAHVLKKIPVMYFPEDNVFVKNDDLVLLSSNWREGGMWVRKSAEPSATFDLIRRSATVVEVFVKPLS